jgi:hypothetical protein
LADIFIDVFVPYFTKGINNFFHFLIFLADILADLARAFEAGVAIELVATEECRRKTVGSRLF